MPLRYCFKTIDEAEFTVFSLFALSHCHMRLTSQHCMKTAGMQCFYYFYFILSTIQLGGWRKYQPQILFSLCFFLLSPSLSLPPFSLSLSLQHLWSANNVARSSQNLLFCLHSAVQSFVALNCLAMERQQTSVA